MAEAFSEGTFVINQVVKKHPFYSAVHLEYNQAKFTVGIIIAFFLYLVYNKSPQIPYPFADPCRCNPFQ